MLRKMSLLTPRKVGVLKYQGNPEVIHLKLHK